MQTCIISMRKDCQTQESNVPLICVFPLETSVLCRQSPLDISINHYSPHQILRREPIKEGLYTSDSAYFITNPSPFRFTDSDCCLLSRDEPTSQAFPCSPYILFILMIICSHPEKINIYRFQLWQINTFNCMSHIWKSIKNWIGTLTIIHRIKYCVGSR
jgi:hypothetical protein